MTCISAVAVPALNTCEAKKNATINESRLILRIRGRYIDLPPTESPLVFTLCEDGTGFSDGVSSEELP
jgi:hypothetical protein